MIVHAIPQDPPSAATVGNASNVSQRSLHYYFEDGDLAIKVENTLYRIHSFHLQRSTTRLDWLLAAWRSTPTRSAEHGEPDVKPLLLPDVKCKDFDGLLWFFYESGYSWSDEADTSMNEIWNSVLLLAEKFEMEQVAKVACHALARARALNDILKISLYVRHKMPDDWAMEAIRHTICRKEPLTLSEARLVKGDMAALLARSREECLMGSLDPAPCSQPTCSICSIVTPGAKAICHKGIHICRNTGNLMPHAMPCTSTPTPRDIAARCAKRLIATFKVESPKKMGNAILESRSRLWGCQSGDIFLQVEGRLFRMHSYHLKRASLVFSDMFKLPTTPATSEEGATENDPVVLDVKAEDFENLLWFFYESPYEWSPTPDPATLPKWESVLKLADIFDMRDASVVALHALDRAGTLCDVRKIALSVKLGLGRNWAWASIKRLCTREEAVTIEEACEMGPAMTASIALARETLLKKGKKGKIEETLRSCIPDIGVDK
ncbi:hypothetical protein EV122DRAFT_267922 [Schizophyllum commune]